MEPLSHRAVVLAYDRPAFGLTERPTRWKGQNPYGADAQIDLLLAMVDALSIDQAILIGNSAGGSLALLAALRHPLRVKALVLVDPAIYLGSKAGFLPGWMQPFLNIPPLHWIGPLLVRSIQKWGDEFARSAWHDPSRITDEIWRGYHLPLRAQNWDRGLWEFTIANNPLHLEQSFERIQVPTLVITGDDDRIVPTANSIRTSQEIQGAQLVVIPASGHIPQEEQPEAFMEAVNQFLDRVSR
jgi:pimeloyl-ACP methyl ester carboxylesterase